MDSAGVEGNNNSYIPSISADGRFVAFASYSGNLVAGDGNLSLDVFIRDRISGQTTRVSVSSAGVEGNNDSDAPSISADGRYVAFSSDATNLVPGDTNLSTDVFVHDRDVSGSGIFDTPGNIRTTRVSVDSAGTQGNSDSYSPSISADGRYVAFASGATNLVSGDMNGFDDIFVRDRLTSVTTRVSVSTAGIEGDGSSEEPFDLDQRGRAVRGVRILGYQPGGWRNQRLDTHFRP